jgi:hypothetical protein
MYPRRRWECCCKTYHNGVVQSSPTDRQCGCVVRLLHDIMWVANEECSCSLVDLPRSSHAPTIACCSRVVIDICHVSSLHMLLSSPLEVAGISDVILKHQTRLSKRTATAPLPSHEWEQKEARKEHAARGGPRGTRICTSADRGCNDYQHVLCNS